MALNRALLSRHILRSLCSRNSRGTAPWRNNSVDRETGWIPSFCWSRSWNISARQCFDGTSLHHKENAAYQEIKLWDDKQDESNMCSEVPLAHTWLLSLVQGCSLRPLLSTHSQLSGKHAVNEFSVRLTPTNNFTLVNILPGKCNLLSYVTISSLALRICPW